MDESGRVGGGSWIAAKVTPIGFVLAFAALTFTPYALIALVSGLAANTWSDFGWGVGMLVLAAGLGAAFVRWRIQRGPAAAGPDTTEAENAREGWPGSWLAWALAALVGGSTGAAKMRSTPAPPTRTPAHVTRPAPAGVVTLPGLYGEAQLPLPRAEGPVQTVRPSWTQAASRLGRKAIKVGERVIEDYERHENAKMLGEAAADLLGLGQQCPACRTGQSGVHRAGCPRRTFVPATLAAQRALAPMASPSAATTPAPSPRRRLPELEEDR